MPTSPTPPLVAVALRVVSATDSTQWLAELGAVNSIVRQSWQSKPEQEITAANRTSKTAWWSAFLAGTAISLFGVAPMLPPRHSQFIELATLMQLTPVPALVGAVVLGVFALLPVPAVIKQNPYAAATATMPAGLALLAIALNAFRVEDMVAVSNADTTTGWFVSVGVILVASAVIGLGSKPRPGTPPPMAAWKDGIKEGNKRAKALRKSFPESNKAEASARWAEALRRLSHSLPAEELAQAGSSTPWDFLVSSYSNPESDLPHPLRPSSK